MVGSVKEIVMSEFHIESADSHQAAAQGNNWLKRFVQTLIGSLPLKLQTVQIGNYSKNIGAANTNIINSSSKLRQQNDDKLARLNREFEQTLSQMNLSLISCTLISVNDQAVNFKTVLPAGISQQPDEIVITLMDVWRQTLSSLDDFQSFYMTIIQSVPTAVHREQFVPINLNPADSWVQKLIQQQSSVQHKGQRLSQLQYCCQGSFDDPGSAEFAADDLLRMPD